MDRTATEASRVRRSRRLAAIVAGSAALGLALAASVGPVDRPTGVKAADVVPPPGRAIVPLNHSARLAPLRASGRFYKDPDGRVVILRGVNLAGDAKVPPFRPVSDPSDLDPIAELGMNVIRLLFIWEAYEPTPDHYDESYLAHLLEVAEAAWARGIYTIVDFHQDGFARCLSRGCGSGFPPWAVSPRARPCRPDNGVGCKNWVFHEVTDPNMHRAFTDFFADAHGARTRYLLMVGRVASAFGAIPGVIGYDLLNEPWGNEATELAPLYLDAAAAIHARHPTAIIFAAGHAATGNGRQTRLPRPSFDNAAYSPHYYNPMAVVRNGWHGATASIDRAFANMEAKCADWGVPLLLGEFGVAADAYRADDYVAYLYDHLDASFLSGTQWNYTPHWSPKVKDGWNAEDYNILDPGGALRPNYRVRPYPRRVAGIPQHFRYVPVQPPGSGPSLTFTWDHRPELGETELFIPRALFPTGTLPDVEPPDAAVFRDEGRQVLICRAPRPGQVRITWVVP